jgi:PepSY-associated TM region
MKKQFYIFHKWFGIIACAAVFAWSLTGFLHPIMSWTQPRPTQNVLKLTPLEADNFRVSLGEALAENKIKTFGGFNIVSFNGDSFYQILPENKEVTMFQPKDGEGESCHSSIISSSISAEPPIYLSVSTGEKLTDGDEKYAEFLARYFADEKKAEIKSTKLVTDFDLEYKTVNRLLPVYEVAFERGDGMKAYVDTQSSKLGTLIDARKSWLQWTFVNFHNLEFAGMPNLTRQITITIFMSLVFLTSLSGLIVYGLFWRSYGKNKVETSRSLLRKYHRSIGVVVSVFLLAWSSSGMFHLWTKADLSQDAKVAYTSTYKVERIKFSLTEIIKNQTETVSISLIGFGDKMFYRILKTDQSVSYFNAESGEILENGDVEYAKFLAEKFSGNKAIIEVKPITKFEGEYGFILKRLPVMKVQYQENSNERVYVDTSNGKLALKIHDGIAQWENLTFDYLHKGHWLDWAGKNIRDVFLMLMALGNSIVAALGIWLFVGLKRETK